MERYGIKYGVFEWPGYGARPYLLSYTAAAYREGDHFQPERLVRTCRTSQEATRIANRLNLGVKERHA